MIEKRKNNSRETPKKLGYLDKAQRTRKERQGDDIPSSPPTLYEFDLTKIPLSEVKSGLSLALAGILVEISAEQGSSRITVDGEEVNRRLRAKGFDPTTGNRSH